MRSNKVTLNSSCCWEIGLYSGFEIIAGITITMTCSTVRISMTIAVIGVTAVIIFLLLLIFFPLFRTIISIIVVIIIVNSIRTVCYDCWHYYYGSAMLPFPLLLRLL